MRAEFIIILFYLDSQINQNKLKAKNLIQLKWIFGDQKKFLLFFIQDSSQTYIHHTHHTSPFQIYIGLMMMILPLPQKNRLEPDNRR